MKNSSLCYDLQEAPQWALILHAVCITIILLASLVGNGLVILLVAKYKRLRRRSTLVSLSVVAVDLLMTVSYHLPVLVSVIAKEWPFGGVSCEVSAVFSYVVLTRLLTMAVLSFDRFSTVRFPFSYERRSKYVILTLTLLAWIVPMMFTAPAMFLAEVTFSQEIPKCRFVCKGGGLCRVYSTFVFAVTAVIGAVLPTVLYSWLYCHARKLRPSALVLGKLSIQVASGAIVSQPIAQLEKDSREIRAIVTFAIIFVTSVVTIFPLFSVRILQGASQDLWCRIPIIVQFIVYEVFMSSTVFDPVVIMRDRDFRNCFKDLCCYCKRNSIADLVRRNSVADAVSRNSVGDVVMKLNGNAATTKQSESCCGDICMTLTGHKNALYPEQLQVNSTTDHERLILHPEQLQVNSTTDHERLILHPEQIQVNSTTDHERLILHPEQVNLQVNSTTDHERLILHPGQVNLQVNSTTDVDEESTYI